MRALPALALTIALFTACGGPSDLAFDEGGVKIAEGSLEAFGVLAFLNGPDVTLETLDVEVDLDARAAKNILRHVRGRDGSLGTRDDNLLDNIAELDAISYVGASALSKLSAYVVSIGALPTLIVEDVPFTQDEANAIVAFVNVASLEQLDIEVELDARAAKAIIAARPVGDIEALAAVSYVGNGALTKLKAYALANPTIPGPGNLVPEVPIPYVLQWINDYRGQGHVSRLNLNRDGTYDATVANAPETGVFYGPRQLPTESGIDLRLIAEDGSTWSAHLTLYSGTSAEVTRAGRGSTLLATLPTDGEDACSDGNGIYLDDDADSSGLYCVCLDGQPWIPSQGGCVGGLTRDRREAITLATRDVINRNDWSTGSAPRGDFYVAELFAEDGPPDACSYTAYIPVAATTPGGPTLDPNTVEEVIWILQACPDGISRTVTINVPL